MDSIGRMGNGSPHGKGNASEAPSRLQEQAVREHLSHILRSVAFRGSKRGMAFLEYTVERVLAGEGDSIKERTLAVEVFGRSPESDLSEDSIVRVGAREVRRRLSQYYSSAEAADDEIEIDLPPGSYIPEFKLRHPEGASVPAPAPVPERGWLKFLFVATVALLAVAAGLRFYLRDPAQEAFETFWRPFLHTAPPAIVAVAHPIVYHPSPRAVRLDEKLRPPIDVLQRPIQLPPNQLDGSDFTPVLSDYVGYGDMVAVAELSRYFATRSSSLRLRSAIYTEFTDLREAPAVLIGAYSNRWTVQFTHKLRFRFGQTADGGPAIVDSSQKARLWSISGTPADGSDYVLLSRLPNSPSGNMIVIAAGLKQFGTEAAGRLLANPAQLGPLLQALPKSWPSKNMQIVLQARIIGNTPARPEVVASHLW
jgi:hypothetical protein